jgi:tRNA A37 methylthiotransferase MiaB
MRGDLVSRPIGDVLNEARALFESGVKELLIVSQDTSAYGVDLKYRTGFWDGKPVRTRLFELCMRWVRWPMRTVPGCGCTTSIRTRMSTRSCR